MSQYKKLTREQMVDKLGQIIFRLETNCDILRSRIETKSPKDNTGIFKDIHGDFEKLKKIKEQLS